MCSKVLKLEEYLEALGKQKDFSICRAKYQQ